MKICQRNIIYKHEPVQFTQNYSLKKIARVSSYTKSGAQIFFSALQGDQITTRERPGRGLFSLGEVQTRRGRSVRPPAHFSDFL